MNILSVIGHTVLTSKETIEADQLKSNNVVIEFPAYNLKSKAAFTIKYIYTRNRVFHWLKMLHVFPLQFVYRPIFLGA